MEALTMHDPRDPCAHPSGQNPAGARSPDPGEGPTRASAGARWERPAPARVGMARSQDSCHAVARMDPSHALSVTEHVPDHPTPAAPLLVLVHGSLDRAASFARVLR